MVLPIPIRNPDYNGINPMLGHRCPFLPPFAKGGRGDLRRAGCRHTACLARGAREKFPLTPLCQRGGSFHLAKGHLCGSPWQIFCGLGPFPQDFKCSTPLLSRYLEWRSATSHDWSTNSRDERWHRREIIKKIVPH